jgi:hypothetical protein
MNTSFFFYSFLGLGQSLGQSGRLSKHILALTLMVASHVVMPQARLSAQDSLQTRHHAGWMGSFYEGSASRGRDEGEFLFSALYAHTLAPTTELEIAFHILHVQRYGNFGRRVFVNEKYASLVWTGDASVFVQPFLQGLLKPLRFGIGPALEVLISK